jgi:pyruvyl transferase EpsO
MHGMDYLKQQLSVIDKYIAPGSDVMYVDYPMHLNLGDILILKGTEKFFETRNHNVVRRYSTFGFPTRESSFPRISKDVVVVLHGGGNFGDIYKSHQILREKVISFYKNNRIVIFPQTMFFQDSGELKKTAAVYARHPDLHFLARDQRTYDTFRGEFVNNAEMCPDMAHSLWGTFPTKHYGEDGGAATTLWMLRRDVEKAEIPERFRAVLGRPIDWDDLCSDRDRRAAWRSVRADQINARLGFKGFPVDRNWYSYTDALVARVNAHILTHDRVVTSRMHGHILACLLGMKTTLLDNSYGKNSTYYQAWTSRVENCDLAAA